MLTRTTLMDAIDAYLLAKSDPPTYCDGCKRFSRGDVCPHCKPEPPCTCERCEPPTGEPDLDSEESER